MGSVWKLQVYYREAFWRDMGYSGSIQATPSETYAPVIYTIDDTKPDGSFPSIIGFMPADRARKLLLKTPDQRLEMFKELIRRAYKTDKANDVVHYIEHNWMEEEYSGGCYTAMCPPGVMTTFRSVIRDPIGRIHFAGTETATEWSGYINGGIQAGERAAKEVLADVGKISPSAVGEKEPMSDVLPVKDFTNTFMEDHMPSIPCLMKTVGTIALISFAICAHKRSLFSGYCCFTAIADKLK